MLETLRENILTDVDSEDLRVIIISGPFFRNIIYTWRDGKEAGGSTFVLLVFQPEGRCSRQDTTWRSWRPLGARSFTPRCFRPAQRLVWVCFGHQNHHNMADVGPAGPRIPGCRFLLASYGSCSATWSIQTVEIQVFDYNALERKSVFIGHQLISIQPIMIRTEQEESCINTDGF